ncbi:MAG: PGPGW domain-containing protein [Nanoarchaeota archaeon]
MEEIINNILRHTKRLIVLVIGGTVLLFGIALIFVPGPAIIVIPLGLMILATEFLWARVILERLKEKIKGKKS